MNGLSILEIQTHQLNRTEVVAVPVSTSVLRQTEPYTEIMDYDPNTDSWSQWAGRVFA